MTARIYSLFGQSEELPSPSGDRTETPIRHAGLARLCELWRSWASDAEAVGGVPLRARIQPEAFRPWLGNLAIVELTRLPFRARYRLVGTALTELAGAELTGRYVDELYSRRIRREVMKAYAEAADNRTPHYRHIRFWLTRRTFGYHRLILPFTSDGRGVDVCLLALYPDRPDIFKASDWQHEIDRAELSAWFGRER